MKSRSRKNAGGILAAPAPWYTVQVCGEISAASDLITLPVGLIQAIPNCSDVKTWGFLPGWRGGGRGFTLESNVQSLQSDKNVQIPCN
jgi:hypothetical protein